MAITSPIRMLSVAISTSVGLLSGTLPGHAQTESVTVVGVLTDEGVECPALRGDDGTLYTLTARGMVEAFEVGERLEVEGQVAQISFCQQGTTISVTRIEPAEQSR